MSTYLFDETSYFSEETFENQSVGMSLAVSVGSGAVVGIYGGATASSGETSGIDGIESVGELSSSFTDTYGGNAMQGTTASGICTTIFGSASSTSEGEPDAIIHVFFHNETPYSYTAKRAEQVYTNLHGKQNYVPNFPVIMADSQESLSVVRRFFADGTAETIAERLNITEELLKGLEKQ